VSECNTALERLATELPPGPGEKADALAIELTSVDHRGTVHGATAVTVSQLLPLVEIVVRMDMRRGRIRRGGGLPSEDLPTGGGTLGLSTPAPG
jgi:hypothetical protein